MNCNLCGTPHSDFVANECVKRLSRVNLEDEIPDAFGVLTEDTIEQAIQLAGTKAGNKGEEAAINSLWCRIPVKETGGLR